VLSLLLVPSLCIRVFICQNKKMEKIVMTAFLRLMLVPVFMIISASVSATPVAHTFLCEEVGEVGEEDIEATASKWLAAAKTMKGGANLQAFIHYPIAVRMRGQGDFLFVVVAPSAAEWGAFWDGYKDSPASNLDDGDDKKVSCPDSSLWEVVKVK
jgi:hypothetical protein